MSDSTLPPTGEAAVQPLRWPPPGLGRIQGDLWVVTRKMAAVAVVLVVPLLVVVVLPQSSHGLGPLGEAWWVTLLTTVGGIALFTDAVVTVARFLSRIRRARRAGYPPDVIALVVSDRDCDNGFLLQGLHAFSPLAEIERRTLARLRFLAPLCYLVSTTWLVMGFGLLLFLAARGIVSPAGVGFGTLGPAAVIAFAGLVLWATEGTLAYRSREAWHRTDWADDLVTHEIEAWRRAGEERGLIPAGGADGAPTLPTVAMVGVLVGAFVAALPPLTLVPASSVGAVFSSVGGWSYESTLRRWAEAEAYRPYRVEPDSAVSAAEAGDLLHVVARAGEGPHSAEAISNPPRMYGEPWLPRDGAPAGFRPEAAPFWTDTIWGWVARGLTREEDAYLRRVAEHPARTELSRLASAPRLDFVGGFYILPFDDDETFLSLPLPRLGGVRAASSSHLAFAALQAAEGRYDEAERSVREVISLGFLLVDETPTLVSNLVGSVVVRNGGVALPHVMRLGGNVAAAEALEGAARAADAAAARMSIAHSSTPGGDEYLRELPEIAEDDRALPGLRWESAHLVTVFSPCANLRRVVFGPDEEYLAWIDRVRRSLVRYESEGAYFDLAMRGIAPTARPSLLTRFLALAMGGMSTRGSCAQVLAALPEVR